VDAAWHAVNIPPPPPPPPTPLTNGVPVNNISGSQGQNVYYSLDVPAGQSTLTFTIAGSTPDADLYVRFGDYPDAATYDCRPYTGTSNETCSFTNPAAGKWYVMINAFTTYSGVTLTGTYGGGGGGGGGLANGGFESGAAPWVLTGDGTIQTSGSAHGGVANAQLGGANTSGTVSQDFQVPASGNNLRFWLKVTSSEGSRKKRDFLYVEVRNTAGALLGTLATYSNSDQGTSYAQKGAFSLAAYAGQTIRLQFRSTNTATAATTFQIDDVTVAP
jgi:hypothetical protein